MTTICKTCGCHKDEPLLDVLNRRVRTVVANNRRQIQNTLDLPRWLINRLTDYPEYQFGVSDFLPSVTSNYVVARVYAAVYCGDDPAHTTQPPDYDREAEARKSWSSKWRFFATDILSPDEIVTNRVRTTPFEYQKGERFKVRVDGAYVTGREVVHLASNLGDEVMLSWLVDHMLVLRDFVLERLSEFAV